MRFAARHRRGHRTRRRTLLVTLVSALTLGATLGASSASAGWYHANSSGSYGTVGNGNYTLQGGKGSWTLGELNNENSGAPKFHFRIRYSAGCTGANTAVQWYSGNYGNPRQWLIPYSAGGCGYSYGQNVSGGNARLAAGQWF